MDAHRAHHLLWHAAVARHGDQQARVVVDGVAVVAHEDALLDAENRAAQRHGFVALPLLGGFAHEVFGGRVVVRHLAEVVDAQHGQPSLSFS